MALPKMVSISQTVVHNVRLKYSQIPEKVYLLEYQHSYFTQKLINTSKLLDTQM